MLRRDCVNELGAVATSKNTMHESGRAKSGAHQKISKYVYVPDEGARLSKVLQQLVAFVIVDRNLF